MKTYTISTVALLLPALGYAVFPTPPPADAGIIEKEIERQYEARPIPPEREIPLFETDIPKEQLQIEGDVQVYISHVEIRGSTLYSDKQLQKIVGPYVRRKLSMPQIQELCAKLQMKYVHDGYFLARVFPPVQTIDKGVLVLEILEGNLGELIVIGNKHYSEEFIKSYLLRFQGRPIHYDQFLRAVFLLNENLDLTVGAVLQKGQKLGTADVILRVSDKLPLDVYVDYNNYGSGLTSLHRSGLRVDYGNCLVSGAQLTFAEVIGFPPKDLNFTDVIYTVPLNRTGTELSLSYIYAPFHVNRFKELKLKGYSSIANIEFSQALHRTRRLSTDISINFSYDQIKNYAQGEISSFDKLRILQLRFDYDYTDTLRGRNIGDAYISWGIPNFLGGLHAVDSECSRGGAGGRFLIFNLDYQRIQQLGWHSYLLLNASGQVTPYKLPIPEQMYIGGQGTVRGYPLAAALGDDGYYFNIELRTPVPVPGIMNKQVPIVKKKWAEFLQLGFFFDQGQVYLNGGGENQSHHISLMGAGLGFRVYGPFNFNFTYDLGFGLSKEKRTSTTVSYFKLSWQIL
ncbi:MAG: ShlB/FhaC/HecB family hemolysin secretion/activation protein [Chlamydiota bacterium]